MNVKLGESMRDSAGLIGAKDDWLLRLRVFGRRGTFSFKIGSLWSAVFFS
jgi:hypothetical protein